MEHILHHIHNTQHVPHTTQHTHHTPHTDVRRYTPTHTATNCQQKMIWGKKKERKKGSLKCVSSFVYRSSSSLVCTQHPKNWTHYWYAICENVNLAEMLLTVLGGRVRVKNWVVGFFWEGRRWLKNVAQLDLSCIFSPSSWYHDRTWYQGDCSLRHTFLSMQCVACPLSLSLKKRNKKEPPFFWLVYHICQPTFLNHHCKPTAK